MGTRQRSGDSAPTSKGAPKPTVKHEDAQNFIKLLMEKFKDQNEKLHEFLRIMKDFQSRRISAGETIDKVQELCEGQKELLQGFNIFMPKEHQSQIPQEKTTCTEIRQQRMDSAPSSKQTGTYQDAQKYIDLVKEKFKDQNEKLEEFFQIIMDYHNKRISIFVMINMMKELLKGDKELIIGFNIFLPKEYESQIPQEKQNS